MRVESDNERRRFAWWVAAGFVVLTVPRLLAHELWRDEVWLWQVVLESSNLAGLAARLRWNGQGYLYPVLCFAASKVSTSLLALQVVNLAFAAFGAWAFVRWAPLGRVERALCVFGYLPFYEYAVISRHYAAGVLLLWLACAATRLRRPALALGAALGLLCQTTVYGFILACAVGGGWWLDRVLRRRPASTVPSMPPTPPISPIPFRDAAAGLALGLAGATAGLMQLLPAAGASYSPAWRFGWQPAVAERVLQIPWRAFVLLPRFRLHFWNSNLLDSWPALQAIGGCLVLAGAFAFLWPRKAAIATFVLGAAGLGAFGYLKFLGGLRHDGHLWLLFLAALWMGGGIASTTGQREVRRSWRRPAFLALLLVHGAAGIFASWMDLGHPFSNAARTAARVHELGLAGEPLLGYREPPAAPVAFALGRPLYFPARGEFATRPDWGPKEHELTPEELRCAARDFAARQGRDIVMILNRELVPPWEEAEKIDAVTGAILPTEDYRLYRLFHARLDATAPAAHCPG